MFVLKLFKYFFYTNIDKIHAIIYLIKPIFQLRNAYIVLLQTRNKLKKIFFEI